MKRRYDDEYDYDYDYQPQEDIPVNNEPEFGCGFCWDRRKQKNKELFFLDAANNMRVCSYCPSCGRKYEED